MFIDIAKIKIVSGKGGDGKVGFHREKYVAAGGPDGGDGGRGGSVIFKVDDNLSTLLDFRYKKKYVAAPGEPGGGKRCKGKDGADLIIRVPRGTIIRDQKTGQVMKDMSDSESFVAAKGGNGGWGNTHFATPTRQAPRFAKPGLPGVERDIILELKLLADVGLVGFPNVGKSTLLSMVSAARPKIANYHFTKLAKIVFSDPAKLQQLNEITTPYIRKASLDAIHTQSACPIVLYDAPTLFEAGADDFCDKIIAVLAPHDTRVARIIERDGLSNEAARARIDAQPNDMFYREKCDFIIENNGDLDMLYRDTDALYSQLIK